MREIRTEVEICASPEKVWGALTDLDAYAEWNPFIKKWGGAIAVGGKLNLLVKPPGAIERQSNRRWLRRRLVAV